MPKQVRIYVYMYICIHLHKNLCLYIYIHIYMYVCIHIQKYIYLYIYMHIRKYMMFENILHNLPAPLASRHAQTSAHTNGQGSSDGDAPGRGLSEQDCDS